MFVSMFAQVNFAAGRFLAASHSVRLIVAFALVVALGSCGNSHTYHAQAVVAVRSVQDILVEENLCRDVKDCNGKSHVFFEAANGVVINVYAVGDTKIAERISKEICRLHESNLSIDYRVSVFAQQHDSAKMSPVIDRNFRRNVKCR